MGLAQCVTRFARAPQPNRDKNNSVANVVAYKISDYLYIFSCFYLKNEYNKHVYQNTKLSAVGYTAWWWSKPENEIIAIKGDDKIRSCR